MIPVSYFIALKAVGDVAYIVGFSSRSDSISLNSTNATLSTIFLLENRGNIPITYDASITVFISPAENHPFNGNFEFYCGPDFEGWFYIGKVTAENKLAPPHGQAEVPGTFEIVSEEALNVIRSGNFTVLWFTPAVDITAQRPVFL
jgi:hypothetical protein